MQVMTEKAIRSIAYSLKKIEKSLDKIAKSTSSIEPEKNCEAYRLYEVIQESFKKLNCENKERENNYERGTLKIKKVYDKKRNKMLILDNISSIKLIFDRLNKISAIEYTEESQYANGVWYSTTFNTCDFKIEFDLGSEN